MGLLRRVGSKRSLRDLGVREAVVSQSANISFMYA